MSVTDEPTPSGTASTTALTGPDGSVPDTCKATTTTSQYWSDGPARSSKGSDMTQGFGSNWLANERVALPATVASSQVAMTLMNTGQHTSTDNREVVNNTDSRDDNLVRQRCKGTLNTFVSNEIVSKDLHKVTLNTLARNETVSKDALKSTLNTLACSVIVNKGRHNNTDNRDVGKEQVSNNQCRQGNKKVKQGRYATKLC
eukprot:909507-Amphidinium_carterae.1